MKDLTLYNNHLKKLILRNKNMRVKYLEQNVTAKRFTFVTDKEAAQSKTDLYE